MKPYLKIPFPDEQTVIARIQPKRIRRPQTDFMTEMIYLPRRRNRMLTLALLLFAYCFFAPRFFGILDLMKTEDEGFTVYRPVINNYSKEYNVPPALVAAMIKVESDFRPHLVSPAGASGLMQLMPDTARALDVINVFNPNENIRGGAKYIRSLLDQFRGNVTLAVAAYNAGPGAVQRAGSVPPYPETQRYVQRVLQHFKTFKKSFRT